VFDKTVTVDYRQAQGEWHIIKVSFVDLGMYIDGFRLKMTDNGWWFQPPARRVGTSWKHTIEFDKDAEFWKWLEAEAIRVTEAQNGPQRGSGYDTVFPMPDDSIVNDTAAFNDYLSDEIDKTLGAKHE